MFPNDQQKGHAVWKLISNDEFSVKSAREATRSKENKALLFFYFFIFWETRIELNGLIISYGNFFSLQN